jgi:hypothetical protein
VLRAKKSTISVATLSRKIVHPVAVEGNRPMRNTVVALSQVAWGGAKAWFPFNARPPQRCGALPPNKWMQLTTKSVTPFAGAKAAPLSLAADPGR